MTVEGAARTVNGWVMLVVDIALHTAATALIVFSCVEGENDANDTTVPVWWMLVTGCVVLAAAKEDKSQNKARTLGRYKVSLPARTLTGDHRKVNDKRGNPVEIVVGAVSMVEMALQQLSGKNVVTPDEERQAAMTSNLLVVLRGESEVHPVVNTGTLYQ